MLTLAEGYRGTVIAMLLKLMAADSHPDKKEYMYVLKAAYEMGMTADDIALLKPEDLLRKEKMPESEQIRMTILYYLLFMMDTDGNISQEEENLVKEFGHILGFRIELVSDLIVLIKTHTSQGAPTEELLNKIRAYLN